MFIARTGQKQCSYSRQIPAVSPHCPSCQLKFTLIYSSTSHTFIDHLFYAMHCMVVETVRKIRQFRLNSSERGTNINKLVQYRLRGAIAILCIWNKQKGKSLNYFQKHLSQIGQYFLNFNIFSISNNALSVIYSLGFCTSQNSTHLS